MAKKKVLVIGGTGAMGVYLVPKLLDRGYLVDVITLDDVTSENENLRYFIGNMRDANFIENILAERRYDGIVDFMVYATKLFSKRYHSLLDHTNHYIYLSSYRVYADEEHPITEDSPRLLEVSENETMLATDTYALAKARGEDILKNSGYRNWTAIRPAITFSKRRFQLVTLEASVICRRAFEGKTVLLPEDAKDVQATLTWANDVAEMIARLLFNEDAKCNVYTTSTAEHNTWSEVAEFYHELIGLNVKWIPKEDFLQVVTHGGPTENARWQLDYDRLYDRIVDNSRVLAATGLTQSDLTPIKEALALELAALPHDIDWGKDDEICAAMDAYLEAHP